MKKIIMIFAIIATMILGTFLIGCEKKNDVTDATHDEHQHDEHNHDEHDEHDHNEHDEHDEHDHDHHHEKQIVWDNDEIYEPKQDGKLLIVTTLFPTYSFAKAIAPDADVRLLLPPGADSHGYEPSPKDILLLENADLIIYTNEYMEHWITALPDSINIDSKKLINASKGIELMQEEHHHDHDEDEDHEHHHDHGGFDPHVWTDPYIAMDMAGRIKGALASIDSQNAQTYGKNLGKLKSDLANLGEQIERIVNNAKRKELYFASPQSLNYFLNRFGLKAYSPFDSCSHHAEANAKNMALILKEVKEKNIPYLLKQEMTNSPIVKQMKEESGLDILTFNTCHTITKDQYEANLSYIDIMTENLEVLEKALN